MVCFGGSGTPPLSAQGEQHERRVLGQHDYLWNGICLRSYSFSSLDGYMKGYESKRGFTKEQI